MEKTKNFFIATSVGKRPLTDMEKCMFFILKNEVDISSNMILKKAKKIKLCASCSDRSEVFSIGERLIKYGFVARKSTGKEYVWSLTEKGREIAELFLNI